MHAKFQFRFLSAASSHQFVMHAVLSFSANQLAWMTQSNETRSLAMQHRAVALRGLHEAIGAFSQANSDAVLAGSLLLAWQATDWYGLTSPPRCRHFADKHFARRNWASLMTGISTVRDSNRARSHDADKPFRSRRPCRAGGINHSLPNTSRHARWRMCETSPTLPERRSRPSGGAST
ncbi:MAG: hypothetical protein INR71_04095 [Terriglobus roseus]|nr:hypothetical protein [Terriglobus roseus]